jgi:hypothetical protein
MRLLPHTVPGRFIDRSHHIGISIEFNRPAEEVAPLDKKLGPVVAQPGRM